MLPNNIITTLEKLIDYSRLQDESISKLEKRIEELEKKAAPKKNVKKSKENT